MSIQLLEIIVGSIFYIATTLCVLTWHRYHEDAGAGYIIPVLYTSIVFFTFVHYPFIDPDTRRYYTLAAFGMLGMVIILFRIVFILRNRGKNNAK